MNKLAILLSITLCIAAAAARAAEVKSVVPLGIPAGKTTAVTIYGEGLTSGVASVKGPMTIKVTAYGPTEAKDKSRGGTMIAMDVTVPPSCAPDTFELTLGEPAKAAVKANLCVVPEAAVDIPIKKPASTYATAMALPGPSAAIEGQLDGDTADLVRFDGHAGERWDLSLIAGRGGSLLDPIVRVRDSRHNTLALSTGDKKKDRRLAFLVPADGAYYVEITEAEAKGGAGYNYRLAVVRRPTTR